MSFRRQETCFRMPRDMNAAGVQLYLDSSLRTADSVLLEVFDDRDEPQFLEYVAQDMLLCNALVV